MEGWGGEGGEARTPRAADSMEQSGKINILNEKKKSLFLCSTNLKLPS